MHLLALLERDRIRNAGEMVKAFEATLALALRCSSIAYENVHSASKPPLKLGNTTAKLQPQGTLDNFGEPHRTFSHAVRTYLS